MEPVRVTPPAASLPASAHDSVRLPSAGDAFKESTARTLAGVDFPPVIAPRLYTPTLLLVRRLTRGVIPMAASHPSRALPRSLSLPAGCRRFRSHAADPPLFLVPLPLDGCRRRRYRPKAASYGAATGVVFSTGGDEGRAFVCGCWREVLQPFRCVPVLVTCYAGVVVVAAALTVPGDRIKAVHLHFEQVLSLNPYGVWCLRYRAPISPFFVMRECEGGSSAWAE